MVQHQSAVIVERCGVFRRVLGPGCHCMLPFADRIVRQRKTNFHIHYHKQSKFEQVDFDNSGVIDLREQIVELPKQPVITRDNVQLTIHPMAFIKIKDPVLSVYETSDVYQSISILLSTVIRGIIGQLTLDDTLASRDEIKLQTKNKIQNTLEEWGVELVDVDILEIDPPSNILASMAEQLESERTRRKMLVQADGDKQCKEIQAEGDAQIAQISNSGKNQSQKIISEAQAVSRREIATAQADAIGMLAEALKDSGADVGKFSVYMYYLGAVQKLAEKSANVVMAKSIAGLAQVDPLEQQ